MKRLIACLLLLTLVLAGCSGGDIKDDADSVGRYGLICKGEGSSLVVHWEFPESDLDVVLESATLDLSRIEQYIDPDADLTDCGVILNTLEGVFTYNRSFMKSQPIGLNESAVKTIIKKKLPIYLQIDSSDGRTFKVRLEYDKNIRQG